MPPIHIQTGLSYAHRWDAARIYFEAFQQKLRPLYGAKEKLLAIFARDVHPEQAIVALEGGTLVGLAGLQIKQRPFLEPRWQTFVDEYGLLPALVRYPLVNTMEHTAGDGELLLDSLSVAASARGRGIGSLLLQAILQFASQYGFRSVGLDVVDTNPRARALYERHGFTVKSIQSYPYLRNFLGFGRVYNMSHPLAEA